MDEPQAEPRTPQTTPKQRVKISDIVIFGVIIIVIICLSLTIMNKLTLKHDVANGRVVTDKLVTDIKNRDGAAALKLGDTTFKKSYTAAQLTAQFKSIAPVTSHSRSVDRQTLANSKSGKTVFVIYKYPTKDLAFYIRVVVVQNTKSHQWQLTSITGSADESTLVVN